MFSIEIEPIFCEKRIIRKKQFDEIMNDERIQSAEESFRIDYFLFFVDQTISSLHSLNNLQNMKISLIFYMI